MDHRRALSRVAGTGSSRALSAGVWPTGTLASALMLKARISSNPLKRIATRIHPSSDEDEVRAGQGFDMAAEEVARAMPALRKVQKYHAARLARHRRRSGQLVC